MGSTEIQPQDVKSIVTTFFCEAREKLKFSELLMAKLLSISLDDLLLLEKGEKIPSGKHVILTAALVDSDPTPILDVVAKAWEALACEKSKDFTSVSSEVSAQITELLAKKTCGHSLKLARINHGMSAHDIAKKLNMPPNILLNIESCQITPTDVLIRDYCSFVKADPTPILAEAELERSKAIDRETAAELIQILKNSFPGLADNS